MWVTDRRRAAIVSIALLAQPGCAIDVREVIVADAQSPFDQAPTPDLPEEEPPPVDLPELDAFDAGPSVDLPPNDVPSDGGPSCAPPQSACGTSCVLLFSDNANCGACANRCASDETCTAGACLASGPSTTRAGALCTHPSSTGGTDVACGSDFVCVPTETTPVCTIDCVDSASQAAERAMCGGAGSTCLTLGEPSEGDSLCTQACSPGAARGGPGSCRAGYVCTGWWFTHNDGRADTPGCAAFCGANTDCLMGASCNVRQGRCGVRLPDMTRGADGTACDPTLIELVMEEGVRRNTQCRGICFQASPTERTHGLCGSYIDLSLRLTCPDDPSSVQPETDFGADNLALCINRLCHANGDCRAPLVCRYYEDAMGRPDRMGTPTCDYPTTAQPTGIP